MISMTRNAINSVIFGRERAIGLVIPKIPYVVSLTMLQAKANVLKTETEFSVI